MGDEHHRDAAALEVAHDAEQQLGLVRVEARGRLVEHQDARVVLERPGDGDELLHGHRIGAERPLDVDVDVEPHQPLARALARLAPGDQPEPSRLAAERQVLGHRHGRDEVDFLVDRADPERPGFARPANRDRPAVEPDLALVAAERAGHDLDQGRLARAVLSEQRMHLAGLDPKIDPLQGAHAGKRLRDSQHLNSRSQGFCPVGRPAKIERTIARARPWHKTARMRLSLPVAGEGRVKRRWQKRRRWPRRPSSGAARCLLPRAGEGKRDQPRRQLPGVAAVCRSEGIFTHFGSCSLGSFR